MGCGLAFLKAVLKYVGGFLYNFQTVWVALLSLFLAWYQWELSNLVKRIDDIPERPEVITPSLSNEDISNLARRLSNIPLWLARRLFVSALLKARGREAWKHVIKKFEEEHISWKKNNKRLKKGNW